MWRLLVASWGGKLIDFSFQEADQERPGASRRGFEGPLSGAGGKSYSF